MIHFTLNRRRCDPKDVAREFLTPELTKHPIIQRALKDIEHVDKVEGLSFYSSDYGIKSIDTLSGGMLTLMLMLVPNLDAELDGEALKVSSMGPNCLPYFIQLSFETDCVFLYDYCTPIYGRGPIDAEFMDDGTRFTDTKEINPYMDSRFGAWHG